MKNSEDTYVLYARDVLVRCYGSSYNSLMDTFENCIILGVAQRHNYFNCEFQDKFICTADCSDLGAADTPPIIRERILSPNRIDFSILRGWLRILR